MNGDSRSVERSLCLLVAAALMAHAHVGSPDVFFEGKAGPYPLLVAIRTPQAIPGVAEIEIRVLSQPPVHRIRITPMPLTGEGAKFAPVPDEATPSKDDAGFFVGSLWMMSSGSWQVRIRAEGDRGNGELAIPVPSVAQRTRPMNLALGIVLAVLLGILSLGIVSIVGAASREALLDPGVNPGPTHRRQALRWMLATGVAVAVVLLLGNFWWSAEARAYDRYIYKPLEMTATLAQGNRLNLRLRDPGWLRMRRLDDFVPDHTHLMHLFAVRLPGMDRAWHLHPEFQETGLFTHVLPPMPAGRYRLFADVVHENGFPETMTAGLEVPELSAGRPIEGDDSAATAEPLSNANPNLVVSSLSDGYKMIWIREAESVPVRQPARLRFRVEDSTGAPASDLELYMGMPGHLLLVKHGATVFAHVHPSGSVPMAALNLAANEQSDPHAQHNMTHPATAMPAEVSFPYGFPSAGNYRLFVQVKRASRVETGVFDVRVR
jgi:hypothetical protein